MIRVTYDNSKLVRLSGGVLWCWLKAFGEAVKKPSIFGQGLDVSGSVVNFAFVEVDGARSFSKGSYVMVEVNGSGPNTDPLDHHYFIMKEGQALFPSAESVNGGGYREYLTQKALAHFTEEQRKEWTESGKLSVV